MSLRDKRLDHASLTAGGFPAFAGTFPEIPLDARGGPGTHYRAIAGASPEIPLDARGGPGTLYRAIAGLLPARKKK